MHEDSGIEAKGKFLGLTEMGSKNQYNLTTGLDHIKELGVTHIHLLPSFDFKTIDESKTEENQFNWGYDPQNYNVPEGSYSTNPYDASVRIRELKQLVQTLHENDLGVILDVVYNHTYSADDSNFNLIMPKYYYRTDESGRFTNGSGCGNEIASERLMVRKFIVESIVYWAKEYKIDGFRFDLMALHDIDTMNEIREELDKIDPSIMMYGEGWVGGQSPLQEYKMALKQNMSQLNSRIAAFSDDIRDGIKGSVFEAAEAGFVSAAKDKDESVKFGIVASVAHSQVDVKKVDYSDSFWAAEPTQTVNYASAHDNLTLWDKLKCTNPNSTDEELTKLNKLSAAIILTSQGIPFFQAGEEMARTKGGDENSYRSSDEVNQIDWKRKKEFLNLFEYYKGLILLRKTFAAFRLSNAEDIKKNIRFLDTDDNVIAYTLENPDKEIYKQFLIIFNATEDGQVFGLEGTTADILVDYEAAGNKALYTVEGDITVPAKSACVLAIRKNSVKSEKKTVKKTKPRTNVKKIQSEQGLQLTRDIVTVGVVAVAFVAAMILKRRK